MNSKNKGTRKWYGILIAIVIFVLAGNAVIAEAKENGAGVNPYSQPVEEQTTEFYVNDFAGYFTEEQKNSIIEKAAQLEEETGGIQLVISTVNTWGKGRTGESYTHAMYNQYEIGEKSMGILITFSREEREILFETGKNMQIFITDAQINDLLDGVMGSFANDQIAEGLMLLQDDVIEEIRWAVPEDWQNQFTSTVKDESPTASEKSSNNSALIVMLLILAALLIILLIISYKLKRKLDSSETEKNKQKRKIDRLEAEIEESKKEAEFCLETAEKEAKKNEEGLNKQITEAWNKVNVLNTQYAILSAWYERAKVLHPELDSEIEIMIENEFKAKADEVDQEIQKCIDLAANPSHIVTFQKAIDAFEALDDNAKRYIKSDIKRLYEYLEKAINMKDELEKEEARRVATEASNKISCIMERCSTGNIETYEDLMSAYHIYERLTKLQKDVFPDAEMIKKLRNLISDANKDCEDVEAVNNAMEKVRRAINGIITADENDLDKLEKAHKAYKALSDRQKNYFDDELLSHLKKLIRQAEEDRDREERRRRERNHHNSYNSGLMHGSMGQNHSHMSTPPYRSSGNSHNTSNNSRPSGGSAVNRSTSRKSTSNRTGGSSTRRHTTTSNKVTTGRGGKGSGATIKRKI